MPKKEKVNECFGTTQVVILKKFVSLSYMDVPLTNYRRLLAAWAENNYLKYRLNFLEILD